jgi:hypothetical protein
VGLQFSSAAILTQPESNMAESNIRIAYKSLNLTHRRPTVLKSLDFFSSAVSFLSIVKRLSLFTLCAMRMGIRYWRNIHVHLTERRFSIFDLNP